MGAKFGRIDGAVSAAGSGATEVRKALLDMVRLLGSRSRDNLENSGRLFLGLRTAIAKRARTASVRCMSVAAALIVTVAVCDGGRADDRETLIGTFKSGSSPLPALGEPAGALRDAKASARDQPDDARSNSRDRVLAATGSIEERFRREAGDRIFFSAGSVDIGARARSVLAAQAQWAKQQPDLMLTVIGHADDGGNAESNVALSAARAEGVRRRLIEEGIEARRIAIISRGRDDRVAACADPACAAQNRRFITVVQQGEAATRLGSTPPAGDSAAMAADQSSNSRLTR